MNTTTDYKVWNIAEPLMKTKPNISKVQEKPDENSKNKIFTNIVKRLNEKYDSKNISLINGNGESG